VKLNETSAAVPIYSYRTMHFILLLRRTTLPSNPQSQTPLPCFSPTPTTPHPNPNPRHHSLQLGKALLTSTWPLPKVPYLQIYTRLLFLACFTISNLPSTYFYLTCKLQGSFLSFGFSHGLGWGARKSDRLGTCRLVTTTTTTTTNWDGRGKGGGEGIGVWFSVDWGRTAMSW